MLVSGTGVEADYAEMLFFINNKSSLNPSDEYSTWLLSDTDTVCAHIPVATSEYIRSSYAVWCIQKSYGNKKNS